MAEANTEIFKGMQTTRHPASYSLFRNVTWELQINKRYFAPAVSLQSGTRTNPCGL